MPTAASSDRLDHLARSSGMIPPRRRWPGRSVRPSRWRSGVSRPASASRASAADRVSREAIADIDDMMSAPSGLDCYPTCRFRGVVFASLLNAPTTALPPHPKVTNPMQELELSEYCADISQCDTADLAARADNLIPNENEIKDRIKENVAAFQDPLTGQFNDLFSRNLKKYLLKARENKEGE